MDRNTPSCWKEAIPVGSPLVWSVLGEPAVTPGGTSAMVLAPIPAGTDVIALRVSDPAGAAVCVQLDAVADPEGGEWVTSGPGDLGPYCLSCPQRVAVGIGYGLFILPSNDFVPPAPAALEVSAGARDCSTLLRGPADDRSHLRIEGLFRATVDPTRAGVIPLGLAFLNESPLADEARRAAVLPETLRLVNELLAPGALQVTVARTRSVDNHAGALDITRGDPGPLESLYGDVLGRGSCQPPVDDGWVPVVFSGCIQIADPLQQTTSEPDGMTPGIPSGFAPPGRAQGIYLKGQSCRPGMDPIDWSPSSLATLLAHELGHYLGLYHSVEADGTVDQLADTNANNLMYYSPLEVAAPIFSPGQLQVMRRHPAIRWSAPN